MKTQVAMLAVLVLGIPIQIWAGTSGEIDHLITFVRNSSVTFIRNGKEYPSTAAAEHLQKKRDHFQKEIKTTEDFIQLAATKSLATGQPYLIKTRDGNTQECGKWLLAELERLRKPKRHSQQ
jgi:hypothetical protein